MAITGPKPTPTATKIIQGNPGQRPLNDDTLKVPPSEDIRPTVTLSPIASREWNRIAPVLHSLGLLTDMDKVLLAGYCEAWSRYQEAQAILTSEGVLVLGYRGSMVKNPAIQVAKDALADVIRIATEFGMTPSSRGRMHIPGTPDDNSDLDGILS